MEKIHFLTDIATTDDVNVATVQIYYIDERNKFFVLIYWVFHIKSYRKTKSFKKYIKINYTWFLWPYG